jgi:hypothetical protein
MDEQQQHDFRVFLQSKNGRSVEITEMLNGLTWSGDYQQVARKLDLEVLYAVNDVNQPIVIPDVGDKVTMAYNGTVVFAGIVWTRDLSSKGQFIKISCYDPLIYINKSNVSYNFRNMTAEAITRQVATDLGVAVGSLATTGVTMNLPAIGKSAYDTIMAAYTKASEITGLKYLPIVKDNALCVIEKGKNQVSMKLDYEYNIEGTQFTESLDGMVSRVIIYDDEGNVVNTVSNDGWIAAYGIIQDAIHAEKDKDMTAKAQKALKPVEQKANVDALGYIEAITGNAIIVKDKHTGLEGLFYIDGDSHTYVNGVYEMKLTIAFQNIMDEKTMEEDKKEADVSDSGPSEDKNKIDNSWLDNWQVDADGNVVQGSEGTIATQTTAFGSGEKSKIADNSWLDNWSVDANGNVTK